MSRVPSNPSPGHPARDTPGGDAPDVRVILVGRTGLDAKLRLDPGVELIRVRSALEAVGELGSAPLARTAVVVTPEAEPEPEPAGPDPLHDFLDALRALDPGVRVLRTAPGARDGVRYDGVIDAGLPAERLRALVRGEDAPRVTLAEGVGAMIGEMSGGLSGGPAPGQSPAPETPATGDAELARALMSGRDLLSVAMGTLRARLGRADVEFIGAPAQEGATPTVQPGDAPVEWRGRTLGVLRCPAPAPDGLGEQAAWLAAWLALREQHAQLRDAAFTDGLTGAWNRRYFDRFLSGAIDLARRKRLSVTVLVFDLDNFKQFNDRYGHEAGDRILVETVRLLRSVIRPSDRVCRIGGDEFAVIFHEPQGPRERTSRHPESVFDVAMRFQRQVCAHRFPALGPEAPGTLTISGGLATFPWDGADAPTLLRRADELALQSKRQGKNAITLGPGAARVCPPAP